MEHCFPVSTEHGVHDETGMRVGVDGTGKYRELKEGPKTKPPEQLMKYWSYKFAADTSLFLLNRKLGMSSGNRIDRNFATIQSTVEHRMRLLCCRPILTTLKAAGVFVHGEIFVKF